MGHSFADSPFDGEALLGQDRFEEIEIDPSGMRQAARVDQQKAAGREASAEAEDEGPPILDVLEHVEEERRIEGRVLDSTESQITVGSGDVDPIAQRRAADAPLEFLQLSGAPIESDDSAVRSDDLRQRKSVGSRSAAEVEDDIALTNAKLGEESRSSAIHPGIHLVARVSV